MSSIANPTAAGPAKIIAAPRRVLLLQGLMGPLFRRLGQGLVQAGHQVLKVNFNGGDRLFWGLPGGIDYRDTLEMWPRALQHLLSEQRISDVILFGDCRDYHSAAIAVCRELAIPVHVFEEGYVRPDWVTLEQGGVNGHSLLPRDPQWFRDQAAKLPAAPSHSRVPSSFRRRAMEGLLYNVADVLTRWYYPHWRNHRPWHPLVEGAGWLRKLGQGRSRRQDGEAMVRKITGSAVPYFLFPLQLDSDAQIRIHSPFVGLIDALKLVIESFASHASPEVRLVIKEHPLDNGVRNWRQDVEDIAAACGIGDRVDYLCWGDIEAVMHGARGVVTINSTSGTLGLAMGVPVVVLGDAIYDLPGITCQGGLDAFWTNPVPPDAATFEAWRRVLIDRCLIPGGFFSRAALDKVVEHAIARIEGHPLPPE